MVYIEISAAAEKYRHIDDIGKGISVNLSRAKTVIKIYTRTSEALVTVKIVYIVISYMIASAGVISACIYCACIVALIGSIIYLVMLDNMVIALPDNC